MARPIDWDKLKEALEENEARSRKLGSSDVTKGISLAIRFADAHVESGTCDLDEPKEAK